MGKQTLFAYARETNLEDVAETVVQRLDTLVAERTWQSKDVWVVNQRFAGPPVEWDLGLNLALAPPQKRPSRWFEDVVAIATELAAMHRTTGRTFVIGIHDEKNDATKDLFVIDSPEPDLAKLKAAFGA